MAGIFFLKKKLCFVVVVIGSGIPGSRSQWLLIFWISLCENKKKVHLKAEEQSRNIRLVEIYVCWIICSHIVTDKVHEIRFLGLTWYQLLKTWPEPDWNPTFPTRIHHYLHRIVVLSSKFSGRNLESSRVWPASGNVICVLFWG